MSAGRRTWASGTTISVATTSSPMGRTCCQGATAAMISQRWPAAWPPSLRLTFSTITTASMPEGRGSPVSTQRAWGPNWRLTGVVSEAPKVSTARTATPSMAEAWKWGEEIRASTGAAVTRPRAFSMGTASTRRPQPTPSQATRRRCSASCGGTASRYTLRSV